MAVAKLSARNKTTHQSASTAAYSPQVEIHHGPPKATSLFLFLGVYWGASSVVTIRDIEVKSEVLLGLGCAMDQGTIAFAVTRAKTGVCSDYQ